MANSLQQFQTLRSLSSLLLCLAWIAHAQADSFTAERFDNWHQWRGPNADGFAPHADPPLHWDESTNIQWKVDIPGSGSSTPIVWGDRIFILTAIDTDRMPDPAIDSTVNDRPAMPAPRRGGKKGPGVEPVTTPTPNTVYQFDILCLDRNNGQLLWRKTAAEEVPQEGHHPSHDYASASPITDGQQLYVSFGSRGLYCYDLDGNFRWKRSLGHMQTKRGFGEGASPALYRSSLVVNWDHEGESFIVCFDTQMGNEKWRTPRSEGTTWNTPLIVEGGGAVQVIINATNRTRSYDLTNGQQIWECGGQVQNPIPSPVARNGIVYCTSGYLGYIVNAIPLTAHGDLTKSDQIAWHFEKASPYIASPLLCDNLLYFTKAENAILYCLDADTGAVVYGDRRLPDLGTIYSSPVGAAGKIYLTGREGTTLVLGAGAQGEIRATNKLDEQINASLALAGKQLFLRGDKHLYAIKEH
ncbi:MAG TPA: PQQ-binding-like beta-propeller repeat protein [Pirellulales bacterium]|jgi:outer membrane protein assembly factor BamB|nr:PQQ-binding-like beta-propeller repeat protein [Pirellulales bacterium]